MTSAAALAGLFLSAFWAATLLPGGSEAALLALRATTGIAPLALLIAASAGNVLGAVANYVLGRLLATRLARRGDRGRVPESTGSQLSSPPMPAPGATERQEEIGAGRSWLARLGPAALLLSWVPVIGDPITLAAGALRIPFPLFLLLVSIAKTGRYLALLGGWALLSAPPG